VAAGMPPVVEGAGAPFDNLRLNNWRAGVSGRGRLFLRILSFGRAKESISLVGARTDFKINRAAPQLKGLIILWITTTSLAD